MGKRLRGGCGHSPLDRSILLRRIKCLNLISYSNADIIIQRLREHYPDYARIKLQPFSLRIRDVLKNLRNGSTKETILQSISDDDRESCKKRGKEEAVEDFSQSKSNLSESESSHDSTSASDDADFDVDPEFDITKSMLRERYFKQSEQMIKQVQEMKNVEIEAVYGKKKKIGMKHGDGRSKEFFSSGGDHKINSESVTVNRNGPSFQALGGMKMIKKKLIIDAIIPLRQPKIGKRLGVSGILFHGPPGCGKTNLAHAIANEAGVPFYQISAPEVVSGVSGASEEFIRDLFNKAHRTAPSIVFIDEIEAIASKRKSLDRQMERRIVAQLMTCMDKLHQTRKEHDNDFKREALQRSSYVLVIGATNSLDSIDLALRRPGRFEREIALGVPNENDRADILLVLARELEIKAEFDRFAIAKRTPGFGPVDLESLLVEAHRIAMERSLDKRRSQLYGGDEEDSCWWRQPWVLDEYENLSIIPLDFEEAIKLNNPSTQREGFSSIPNVTWEDIGGLDSLRKEFNRCIARRIKKPKKIEELGMGMDSGFLLYGPQGCGKSLIAKAIANEAGANFIHIKGSEILTKYVGESEQEVRRIFSRARTCSPCIIFFDEVDALTPKRGGEDVRVGERVLAQLLIELDGGDQRHDVYVIGATNCIEAIDPAVLRPGRFGRLIYVPLPSLEERILILKALSRNKPVCSDVDFTAIASNEACKNLSGSDLYYLVQEACMSVLDEMEMCLDGADDMPLVIKNSHFEKALEKMVPSISKKQRCHYEALSHNFRVR